VTPGLPQRLRRAALGAVAVALLAAAPALATTETASGGDVQATFTYTKVSDFEWKDLRLQITRAGQPAFDAAPAATDCEVPYCAPLGAATGKGSLRVVDLDADGEPEVVLDLYTGGAHCCVVSEVLRWTGTGYAAVSRNWADPGYQLVEQAGAPATFVTGDARFAYVFASFADSRFPVRLLTFRGGTWQDVTREHPDSIRADAGRWAKEYRKRRDSGFGLGVLAAWVADEYLLGRRTTADRFVNAELRAGRLRGDRYWPRGKGYITVLRKRLRAWGYASS
jgi:hypothetical protein